MTKEIAIVTGATGGIGREFIRVLDKEALDEIWIIGRNKEQLTKIKEQYVEKIIPICMDLTNAQDLQSIQTLLTENVRISY
ncbi:MAG: SDR family NAD(P)-dependent oxidoreductase, partial [Lachnospiraceae bacterium]|nr:SDR family NAD(P)-dependent oxidoreductase [Lachnospiraceae bacterium]